MMHETWTAIGASRTVKELIIINFIPKWTSAIYTAEFRQFLSQLESASISVWGADHHTYLGKNTEHVYLEFFARLGGRNWFCSSVDTPRG